MSSRFSEFALTRFRSYVLLLCNCSATQTVPNWGTTSSDYGRDYVAKVNELGGGRLKIDFLNSGAVVKPFSVMDATSTGVLDGNYMSRTATCPVSLSMTDQPNVFLRMK